MKKIGLFIVTMLLFFFVSACGNTCDHEWSEWKTLKNPTCSSNGEKEHYCLKCEKVASATIEKLEHSFGAAYAKNEQGHYRFCEICGYEEAHEDHTGVENELGNVRCSVCEYLISENSNSFYDNLFKTENNFIIELKNLDITEEIVNVVGQEIIIEYSQFILNGHAIFMDTDNGVNILVQGDLTGETVEDGEKVNGAGRLDAVLDGENVYFKATLTDSTDDYEQFYSCKASADFIMNMLYKQMGLDLSMLEEHNETITNIFPGVINKLFNLSNNELTKIFIDFLFVKEETKDGYTLTFNLDKVAELIDYSTSKPVNSIFDKVFGKNQYEISKKNLIKIFDAKFSNLVKMMQVKYNIDVKQILIDICKIQGSDPSQIELTFNDEEFMNKTLMDFICEENDLSRDEVLEELNNIFKELETEVIVLDKYTADQILEVINLINDTINLVITTDKEGFIEKIDLGCTIDYIEDVEISGNLSIKEYLNEEQFNTAKAEIVELYQETIPTIDWDKVPEESKDLITDNDSTIVVKVVQPHYSYSYDYETGTEQYKYYNEYLYLTFDIEDVLGVVIDNSSNPSMANWDSHINVDLIANCSGKCVIDGQWYLEDGTELSYDYSLEEEYSIKDRLYNISIFYDSEYECFIIDTYSVIDTYPVSE